MSDKSKTTHLGLEGLISATKDGIKSVVECATSAVKGAVKPKTGGGSSGKGRYSTASVRPSGKSSKRPAKQSRRPRRP